MSDHNSNNPSMTNRGQNRTRALANFTIHDDDAVPGNSPHLNRRRANTEVLDRRGWSWNEEERIWLPPRPSTTQPTRIPTTASQSSRETPLFSNRYIRLVGRHELRQYNTHLSTPVPDEPRIASGHEGNPAQHSNQPPGNWPPARDPAFTAEFARAMTADDGDDGHDERTNDSEESMSSLAPESTTLEEGTVEQAPRKRKRDIIRGVFQGFTSRLNRKDKDDRGGEGNQRGRRRASTMPSF